MYKGHLKGERFCGNYMTRKVHDLQNEKSDCHIKLTIESGEEIPFQSLEIAVQSGYRPCRHCLNNEQE